MASKVDNATWRMRQLCEVWSVGYSQPNRWHLWDGGAADCSSATYDSLWYGGLLPRPANTWSREWWTGTIPDDLTAAGFTRKAAKGKPRYGTVLWRPGHVAMCIDHDGNIDEAYMSETYGIHGADGDQTGWETRRARWDYPSAAKWWTAYFVPPESAYQEPVPPKPKPTVVPKKGPDEEVSMPVTQGDVARLYNRFTGEHVYTTDANEASTLKRSGWTDEGIVGVAPVGYSVLWRLRNADTGEHLWTDDYGETKSLLSQGQNLSDGTLRGWQYEGEAMVVHDGDRGAVKMHRLYRKGAPHLLTADRNEIDSLVADGWTDEGVKFSLDAK